jgi:hypothetical protein
MWKPIVRFAMHQMLNKPEAAVQASVPGWSVHLNAGYDNKNSLQQDFCIAASAPKMYCTSPRKGKVLEQKGLLNTLFFFLP